MEGKIHKESQDTMAVEHFWDDLRLTGALRTALDRKAAKVASPNFDALEGLKKPVKVQRWAELSPWTLLVAAAAACFLVAFWTAPAPSANHPLASSVIDQVFWSTASLEWNSEKGNEVAYSPVLKTIDAGIAHWDEPSF